jgi:hypothetical protein
MRLVVRQPERATRRGKGELSEGMNSILEIL